MVPNIRDKYKLKGDVSAVSILLDLFQNWSADKL